MIFDKDEDGEYSIAPILNLDVVQTTRYVSKRSVQQII